MDQAVHTVRRGRQGVRDTAEVRAGLRAVDVVAGYDRRAPIVRDASITVAPSEAVGMFGPSGCGKSTLARVLAMVHVPYGGAVFVDGDRVGRWRFAAARELRTRVGVLFQQPRLSVDPRLRLRDVIAEPLRATGRARETADLVPALAEEVGLTGELLGRRPHEVSDGQLQRACLARALVLRPRYLVCDEMTSMLDASTTAALVGVVERYRAREGAGLLAVSHDPVLLDRWCDRVIDYPGGPGTRGSGLADEAADRPERPRGDDDPTPSGAKLAAPTRTS